MKKIIAFTMAALMITAASFAQEDDWGAGDDWGDASTENLGASEGSGESGFSIGGDASVGVRAYLDERYADDGHKNIKDWTVDVFPSLKLNLGYEGSSTAFSAKLKLDKNSLGDYNWDILDEFKISFFAGNFLFEAGKMRIVWGKADKLHVLDNFNANDYTDYIIPDYIDRRISDLMFKASFSTKKGTKIEAVYVPWLTPDRLGTGVWQPKATKTLASTIESSVKGTSGKLANATVAKVEAGTKLAVLNSVAADYTGALAHLTGHADAAATAQFNAAKAAFETAVGVTLNGNASDAAIIKTLTDALSKNVVATETAYLLALNEASSFSADDLYPDTHKLKYSQAGLRVTFAAGPVDLGFSYYYGFNKQPSVDKYLLTTFAGDTTKITDGRLLDYDRLQVFGFEGAVVIPGVGLNTRWEFAYNLTDDISGDDPTVLNNSISWVFGFDRDIPLHNINLNIQTQGKYILKNSKIEDMGFRKAFDVDYVAKNDAGDGVYSNNKIVLDISDTWNYEKIKLDIKAIWGIERKDIIILPTLTFKTRDTFKIDLSGMFIWCKNDKSEFDGWEHNSFFQIAAKYSF